MFFGWKDHREAAAVDIVFEDRHGGLTLAGAERNGCESSTHGAFWIASPQVEFPTYSQKSPQGEDLRKSSTAIEVSGRAPGKAGGGEACGAFLKGGSNRRAVESCRAGSVTGFLQNGRTKLWRMSVTHRRGNWFLIWREKRGDWFGDGSDLQALPWRSSVRMGSERVR